jgi:hypothetical protein
MKPVAATRSMGTHFVIKNSLTLENFNSVMCVAQQGGSKEISY